MSHEIVINNNLNQASRKTLKERLRDWYDDNAPGIGFISPILGILLVGALADGVRYLDQNYIHVPTTPNQTGEEVTTPSVVSENNGNVVFDREQFQAFNPETGFCVRLTSPQVEGIGK